ncbi:DnaJ C-terminal domain-containing protein [Mycoplasmopsis felifaucium]|uniref:Chaperone protein DnaJ n=1 Tax=Mycoplasmopsis felifaucium TaxID=35768 RepID=A0ABZ2RVS7_9BACT|nr:DnaJ C-terminal domain-containing protein [Mycoplasmopsis felifaucium]
MSNSEKDYYKILGVSKTATEQEIKTAYRKLAMKYHPDKLKDGTSDQKMQELNQAYEVLSDPTKRANYDKYGTDNPKMGGFNMNMGDFGDVGGFGFNFQDIISDIFGGFGGARGSRRGSATTKARGADLLNNITVDFEDIVKGTVHKEKLYKWVICEKCQGLGAQKEDIKTCSECHGTGHEKVRRKTPFGITEMIGECSKCHGAGTTITKVCSECQGKQYLKVDKNVNVIISPGAKDGDKIKLDGFGEKGINGGPVGDMYVVIHVRPHKYFKREGLDVILNPFPVSFIDIVKEKTITVPTPNGDQTYTLKRSFNNGQIIRLKGHGLTNKTGQKGDLIIKLEVVIPELSKGDFDALANSICDVKDKTNEMYVKEVNKN